MNVKKFNGSDNQNNEKTLSFVNDLVGLLMCPNETQSALWANLISM